jgi:ribosomal protein L11 methyltransferase
MRVADIGTGSGILAIATARLGASEVLATDIDSLPRRIARENVERNGLSDVISVLDMEPFDQTAYDRDLIVANIVANTIIEIAPTVAPRLRQGGIFIASGIVEEHHDLVRDALEALGLQHLETLRDDIWVCLVSAKLGTPDPDSESIQRASEALPSLMAQ